MDPVTSYGLARSAAPAFEPATLAEVKTYLRITHTEEDALFTNLLTTAREQAEQYLNLTLPQQSYVFSLADNEVCEIKLPRGPIISVASVTLFARDGTSSVVDPATYYIHSDKHVLVFDNAPSATRIEIAYTAGFATASAIPKPIKLGLLAHVASLYDGRGDAEFVMPKETLAFYAPYREVRV